MIGFWGEGAGYVSYNCHPCCSSVFIQSALSLSYNVSAASRHVAIEMFWLHFLVVFMLMNNK